MIQNFPKISQPNSRGLVADTIIFGLKAFAEAKGLGDYWLAQTGRRWCLGAGLIDRKGNPLSYWQAPDSSSDFSQNLHRSQPSNKPLLTGTLTRRACCKDFLVSVNACASCPLDQTAAKAKGISERVKQNDYAAVKA
ncbi:hypothetical protein L1F30_05295 [Simiduia sp. 21SJ11W-1]|uniref:hypothetical protein n=1 Tax=Simiduia sp. 21SJ11W-1 TaxID=2909669 RepID=UPI0020A1378A|nr:hypothetical protein [Simiduia sp. 21SJ11W-1]UTA48961.1 hypothetical protein L1F30_05295 [Simiduia sp. 21SJ11W-1]